MKGVRRHGTSPELIMRRLVRASGAQFRLHNRDLPGSPDLANRSKGWAVFVNGCFWHGHEECPAARLPKTNSAFWSAKIADNVRRDKRKLEQLTGLGFKVLVVWECDLKRQTAHEKLLRSIRRLTLRR